MKILILGEGRHGKDEVAEYWRNNFGITFQSSSQAAAESIMFPLLKDRYSYSNVDECFNDRHNHRKEWFDGIVQYNTPDKTKLAKKILETSDLYVGLRDINEFSPCKKAGMFDLVIWIDASERVPSESNESCTVTKECADIIITNNSSLEEFHNKLKVIGNIIFKKKVNSYE